MMLPITPRNVEHARALRPEPGKRVLLCQARHWPNLAHRKLPVYGRITRVNGGYIYVRVMWSKRVVECYENEIVVDRFVTPSLLRRMKQRPRRAW